VRQEFSDLYGREPRFYRAPGRVNLIGEHTDYNDGFALPAAIGMFTWVALAPRSDHVLRVHSKNLAARVEIDLEDRAPRPLRDWSDYVRGVVVALRGAGHELRGADVLVRGDVPVGSGLSSSAALEVAVGYALLDNSGVEIDRVELARLCQRAENEFVGMRCGIMDQFIVSTGHVDHATLLDCRSLESRQVPVPDDARLVICNTMVKHALASGEYNVRRAECEAGVRELARSLPGITALRDVSMVELERFGGGLPETIFRRCRHVVGENARTVEAAAALERNDLAAFGKLMDDSHRSLRDDYEVSCEELDVMVDLARGLPGLYGARMTGGGFGGCTINLVAASRADEFAGAIADGYERSTGLVPQVYVCATVDGVRAADAEEVPEP
jgi:galactokinase